MIYSTWLFKTTLYYNYCEWPSSRVRVTQDHNLFNSEKNKLLLPCSWEWSSTVGAIWIWIDLRPQHQCQWRLIHSPNNRQILWMVAQSCTTKRKVEAHWNPINYGIIHPSTGPKIGRSPKIGLPQFSSISRLEFPWNETVQRSRGTSTEPPFGAAGSQLGATQVGPPKAEVMRMTFPWEKWGAFHTWR